MSRYDIALGHKPPVTIDPPEIQYHGWINWRVASKRELMAMGVKGEIKLEIEGETHYYSNCIITESLARELMKMSKYFYPGAFTAVDDQGQQLPPEQQILWKL
jgi:hypothetical protein